MWCSSAQLDELLDEHGDGLLQLRPNVQRDDLGNEQLKEQLDNEEGLQRRKVFSRGIGELIGTVQHLTHALVEGAY